MDERAVVLWLPGGGWHSVSTESGAALTRHGLRVVVGRYRLTPEATWPDQLADIRAAAREVRSGAGGLPLLVAGDSAGGHLALQLGLRGIDRRDDVAGVLAFWPPVDPRAPDWPRAHGEINNPWRGLLGHRPAADDPATVDATPLSHVGNRVPVLLVYGNEDPAVPATQTVALTTALLSAGHPVHALVTHGGHALDLSRPDLAAVVAAFLDTHLGPAPPGVRLAPAGRDDAGQLLSLQRSAYVSEAQLYRDLELPALTQTLPELTAELAGGLAVKAMLGDRLVGAVRGRIDGATLHIGRLTVAPDQQGRGIGTALLEAIEDQAPSEVDRFGLFTGHLSTANIRLYQRLGYTETHRAELKPGTILVHLARARAVIDK